MMAGTARKKCNIVRDPRPDLAYDSREWTALLTLVTAHDKVVGGILHGFRCAGMRLHRARNGYVLEPDIGGSTWPTRARYEADRDKWLRPHTAVIVGALRVLSEEATA